MNVYELFNLGEPTMQMALPPQAGGNPTEGLDTLQSLMTNLLDEIGQAESAAKSADKVKVADPLAEKYGKDDAGKKAAHDFFRENIGAILDWCADDAGRTFHMSNEVSALVKYFNVETTYYRELDVPKVAKVSAVQTLKRQYNGLRKYAIGLVNIVLTRDAGFAHPFFAVDGKEAKPTRPAFMGLKPESDGTVTGKYARIYSLAWNVDGEDLNVRSLAEVSRALYSGVDRIGKNASDLASMLDEVAPEWKKGGDFETTFEVNGHTVVISHGGADEDEDEDTK